MTDDWAPENLPIMLVNRSLLTSTRNKPIRIGKARVTAQDETSLIAMDAAFENRANQQIDKESRDKEDDGSMMSRYEADAAWIEELTGLAYQVSYYFPSAARPNKVGIGRYGAPNMTYRVLYEALCNAFNGGRRFIEDYFLSVFEQHMRGKYDKAVRDLKQRIVDEAQVRRKAHKAYLSNFSEWASPMTKETFDALAAETRQDIIASLASGKIPLAVGSLSPRTLEARKRLGIPSTARFYATGKLISSIVVSVILLDKTTASVEGVK